jgi:pilus assembly protein CpaB
MRPKTLVLFALALGCGSIAAVGINQLLTSRTPVAPVPGDTESILVAMSDVGMGELITPQMVKLERWPKDNVPPGALTRLDQIEGRRAKAKLFAGEPILEPKLLSKDSDLAGASQFIPKGYRVVAVKVDDISAASNLIKPGDRVDVLVHLRANPGSGINETKTITVLQDIKVFSVNDVFHARADAAEQAIAARTVSLLVTPDQAELITHATELGTIRLVMRSVDDDAVVQTEGASQADLLAQREHGERDKEEGLRHGATGNALLDLLNSQQPPAQAAPAAAPAASPSVWRMVLIEADKAQEVQFEDAARLPTAVLPLSADGTPVGGPLPPQSLHQLQAEAAASLDGSSTGPEIAAPSQAPPESAPPTDDGAESNPQGDEQPTGEGTDEQGEKISESHKNVGNS